MMLQQSGDKPAVQPWPGAATKRTCDAVVPDWNPGPSAKEGGHCMGGRGIALGLALFNDQDRGLRDEGIGVQAAIEGLQVGDGRGDPGAHPVEPAAVAVGTAK